MEIFSSTAVKVGTATSEAVKGYILSRALFFPVPWVIIKTPESEKLLLMLTYSLAQQNHAFTDLCFLFHFIFYRSSWNFTLLFGLQRAFSESETFNLIWEFPRYNNYGNKHLVQQPDNNYLLMEQLGTLIRCDFSALKLKMLEMVSRALYCLGFLPRD